MSFLPAVKIWIWLSVFASAAGWALGLLGFLHPVGYLILGGVALVVLVQAQAQGALELKFGTAFWHKARRRFRRGYPLAFVILAGLAFIGGALYPPTNHTGLSYRVPRVLQWLEAGEWHWIFTPNLRQNTRACGMEWLTAPMFLFLKSDRALFLLNFFPFLLMPGLIYSGFTRLGVRARVAWQWMWLLPTGYVFLLQAGSAGNDAFPATYALAAMDFGCRAWKTRKPGDIWHSLLAVALLNGAKASNLPLTLPWLVLVFPLWRVLKAHPLGTVRVAVLAFAVSFLPTAILNIHYLGDWSALKYERPGMGMHNPVVGAYGNALLLLINNLCPPFFPLAGWWNRHALQLIPGPIVRPMMKYFEDGFHALWELPTEDWAGLGFGVTLVALVAAWHAARGFKDRRRAAGGVLPIPGLIQRLALWTPWVALLAYCMKSGMVTPARLIAPYYALLLPVFLVGPEQSRLVRRGWWKWLGGFVFLSSLAVLVVTPPRPLWPVKTLMPHLRAVLPGNRLLERAQGTYAAYAVRNDPLPELRAKLPPDLKVIGFLGTHDDLDISFWRPFGSRRVQQIGHRATAEDIRAQGLLYAVVSGVHFQLAKLSFEDWLTEMRAEVIAESKVTVTLNSGEQHWYLVRFKD